MEWVAAFPYKLTTVTPQVCQKISTLHGVATCGETLTRDAAVNSR